MTAGAVVVSAGTPLLVIGSQPQSYHPQHSSPLIPSPFSLLPSLLPFPLCWLGPTPAVSSPSSPRIHGVYSVLRCVGAASHFMSKMHSNCSCLMCSASLWCLTSHLHVLYTYLLVWREHVAPHKYRLSSRSSPDGNLVFRMPRAPHVEPKPQIGDAQLAS